MQSLMILGRQAELGLAELASLYGTEAVTAAGTDAAIVDVDPCLLAFDRLGGSMKFCKLLISLDSTDWKSVETFLIQASPEQSRVMPEGKMKLGISAYGFKETTKRIEATGLSLKKAIQKTGRSARLVPNKETALNTASVTHNKLLTPNGWELVIVRDGTRTHIAQTVKVQNIDAYAKRDRQRPMRDSKVGMLPPKLAQIIINLAVGRLAEAQLQNICDIPAGQPVPATLLNQTILDPFCGTGVVLQEAALMGYHTAGSDLEPRMITYSTKNMEWLREQHDLPGINVTTEIGDATDHTWSIQPDFVAGETYLGRPFTSKPSAEVLAQTVSECNLIIKKFLQNIHAQLKPGTRLCLAVPAWQIWPGEFRRLPLLDNLDALGFEAISFENVTSKQLIYSRSDQYVGRQLVVLISH